MTKILSLWPELELIHDLKLKSDVIKVWEYAISTSKLQLDELYERPFTDSILKCRVPFITHKRLVVNIAYQTAIQFNKFIKDFVEVNLDYVVAGAILIDVGKLLENIAGYKGKHHAKIGVELSDKFGLNRNVRHIIESHTKEYGQSPKSPEASIVRSADLMSYYLIKSEIEGNK